MICPQCSFNNDDDARFCTKCGANLVVAQSTKPYPNQNYTGKSETGRSDLLTLVGIVDIVFGILSIFVAFTMYSILYTIPGTVFPYVGHMGAAMVQFMQTIIWFIFIVSIVISVPMIIAGIGILSLKSWSRILHMVVWAPVLLWFPIGTLIGIFQIWAVTTQESTQLLQQRS